MGWFSLPVFNAWRIRRALSPEARNRLDQLRARIDRQAMDMHEALAEPLALARFVCVDFETTGPNMHRDRIISIGAVAVTERVVCHDDAFEVVLRQAQSSDVENILIHQIGGQEQLAGAAPVEALMGFLDFMQASIALAFRAEFDETVFRREINAVLGLPQEVLFLDLALILPALFPNTANDSLDDWVKHFALPPIGRHHAIADAYANAQLMLLVLEQAQRSGMHAVRELVEMEKAQRWLGKRR